MKYEIGDKVRIELNTTFKEGDIVTDGHDKRKILGVCGEVYFVSRINEFNEASDLIFTGYDLIENNYKLEGEKAKEMTVAEISEELGRDIKVIK